MPVLGKEVEPRLSPEQIAVHEVQDYVEKIERQVENQQQANQQQPQQQQAVKVPVSDSGRSPVGSDPVSVKPKIILPVDQLAIQTGLGRDVSAGVRWLSEWCVMMIKKYPGRVFYMPPEIGR